MFALECASLLTQRVNLTHRPLDKNDRTAAADALQATPACYRCPDVSSKAIPNAMRMTVEAGKTLRSEPLLGIWALAREQIAQERTQEQELWLVQHSRCILPREALEALLGLDRSATLGLIGHERAIEELKRQQNTGLCDNHLHSGAADELGDLLERLVPRVASDTEPRELQDAVGTMRYGSDLNMGPPVLGLAAACLLLDEPEPPEARPAHLLASEAWWRDAAGAALSAEQIDSSGFAELRKPIQELAVKQDRYPQLKALYSTLRSVARGEPVPQARQEAAKRGLISLAVLYGLVAIPHSSSLGTFVPRFDAMRALRGLFGDDPGRLTSAINSMFVYGSVTAVELRKSIVPGRGPTISVPRIRDSIKLDIEEHAWSAIAACKRAGRRDLLTRMPITFTRREYEPVDLDVEEEGYVPFRDPVGETLAVADAIVQATADQPDGRFVGAVDVVGDEKLVPNWLYALAFQRVAASCDLEFACHAGEYFADRLEGLRRIGEVALFRPVEVRRIGHCLALGTDNGAESDAFDGEAGVLLENATWALLVLEDRDATGLGKPKMGEPDPPEQLLAGLKQTIQQIASRVFGFDAGVGDIRRWYLDRFDATVMARWLPELQLPAGDTTSWPRGVARDLLPRPTSLSDGMLAATAYEMPVELETDVGAQRVRYDPSASLPADLRKRVQTLQSEVEEAALTGVTQWLRSEKIVIESCPSSNAALGNVPITEHPVWAFHREELHCSINTDDPALFGASLGEEYLHAATVADRKENDGADFVAELAETSRTVGMIERELCGSDEDPVDIYHALLRIREPPADPG